MLFPQLVELLHTLLALEMRLAPPPAATDAARRSSAEGLPHASADMQKRRGAGPGMVQQR